VPDVIDQGATSLLSSISLLPPGAQVAILVLLAMQLMTSALALWALKELRAERRMAREDGVKTRDTLEQTAVALALIKDRLSK